MKIFDQIPQDIDKIGNPDWKYDFLYQNFNRLSQDTFSSLLFRFDVLASDIFYSAAKNNHIDFLIYILNQSIDSSHERLILNKGAYGNAISGASQNNNIEALRLLVEILSVPDKFKKINVSVEYHKMGIAFKKDINQLIYVGKFLIELLESKINNKNFDTIGDKAYMYIQDNYLIHAVCYASRTDDKEFLEYIINLTTDSDIKYNLINNHYNSPFKLLEREANLKAYEMDHMPIPARVYVRGIDSLKTEISRNIGEIAKITNSPFRLAVRAGRLNNLKLLFNILKDQKAILSTILKDNSVLLKLAAQEGHLEIFKYLIELIPVKYIDKVTNSIADFVIYRSMLLSNLEFVKYLFELMPEQVIRFSTISSSNKSNFLVSIELKCFEPEISIEVFKYFMGFNKDINEIVKGISYNDYKLTHSLALKGRHDILKYLVELVNEQVIIQEMLQFNDYKIFRAAADWGHIDTLKFLVELLQNKNCINNIIDNDNYIIVCIVTINGHLDILKYLEDIYSGQSFIKKMILSNNYLPVKLALYNGQTEIFKFYMKYAFTLKLHAKIINELLKIDYIYSTPNLVDKAINAGHFEIVKYLLSIAELSNETKKWLVYQALCVIRHNNFEFLKYVLEKFQDLETIRYIIRDFKVKAPKLISFELGDDDPLKKIEATRHLIDKNDVIKNIFAYIASTGRIEFLKYFLSCFSDQESKNEIIHEDADLAFREAAFKGHVKVLKYLIELTPEVKLRNKMIHSCNDGAFSGALRNGYIDILHLLIELTPEVKLRNKMIYQGSKNFKVAAAKGLLDSLKFIVDIAPAPELISKMIKEDDFYAFRKASANGFFHIIKYLIDLSDKVDIPEKSNSGGFFKDLLNPFMSKLSESSRSKSDSLLAKLTDNIRAEFEYMSIESFKYKMIHAKNDEAFRMAASNEHIGCMNYILNIVDDAESKKKMIRTNNDQVLKEAIKNGKIHIVEFLLESFLDKESNNKILYPDLEEAISNNELVKYLGEIDPSADLSFIDFTS